MEYENEVFGCAFCCPVIERLVDCPFNEIEHLSIEEKVRWIRALSAERKKSVIEHHLFCTRNREQK